LNTGSAQSRVHKRAYYDLKAYQLATPAGSPTLTVETVAEALGSPSGFIMKDANYVRYHVEMSTRGVLSITPSYTMPAEDLVNPIFHVNDTAYHLTLGKVDTWTDISNSRKNAVQYNPVNQPTFVPSALNGHGIFRFAGGGQFMDLDNLVIGGNLTVFVVAANTRTTLDTSVDTLISSASSGGVQGGLALATYNFYGDPSTRKFSADFTGGGTPTIRVTGSTSPLTLTKDVFKVLTFQCTNVTARNFSKIGLYNDGALNGSNDIAEIIIYQGILGTSARGAVESGLITKYGIT
jgi:hypothetical protein